MRAWSHTDGKDLAVSNWTDAYLHRGASVISPSGEVLQKRSIGVDENYLVAVGSRSARQRKKYKEKIIIIALIGLIFILLVILIVLCSYYFAVSRETCESKECVRSAANLIMSMDRTANPCEDFYKFSCGNWGEQHPAPDFHTSYGWFVDKRRNVDRKVRDILSENRSVDEPLPLGQAKEMYTACIDIEKLDEIGLKPTIEFLRRVGLPALPTYLNLTKKANPEECVFDWLWSVTEIKRTISLDVIVGFDIFPDPTNATIRRIVMGEPSSSNPIPSYTEWDKILMKVKKGLLKAKKLEESDDPGEEEEEDEDEKKYRKYFKILFQLVIKEFIKSEQTQILVKSNLTELESKIDKTIDKYIDFSKSIIEMEDKLANVTKAKKANTSDDENDFIYSSIDGLQNITDLALQAANLTTADLWGQYLIGLFNGSEVKVDREGDLILFSQYDLAYMMAIATFAESTPSADMELYIWFQAVENLIPQTNTVIRDAYDKYVRTLTGVEGDIPRSIRCASSISAMMGMAVGYAVADPRFLNSTLPKVERMLNNIKSSFEDLVVPLGWMDFPTKSATIEKVRAMRSLIGFPGWLLQKGKLEKYYRGITADPESHLDNMIGVLTVGMRNTLNTLRKPYSVSWDTPPTEVNAYHTFSANAIISSLFFCLDAAVPLVMLQYPFYDLGLEALNYGSIGTVLGHEITHGFDNYGRQYDKDGTFIQWWTNTTIDSFVNKTKCFIKQYSQFYVPEVHKYVNGNLTLGENIADNGGVRTALKGFWKEKSADRRLPGLAEFTPNQLFFLSYGNLWCGIDSVKSLGYDLKDEHSPNKFRLKGVLQNTPEFAEAWSCPFNSTMNPARPRCVIF